VPSTQPEIEFRSDVTVELVRSAARDADVLFAARVSTQGEQTLEHVDDDASRSKGLINFLMRDRHGCYDSDTEVLTFDGWKGWPDVDGSELFATLSPAGVIEYQHPQQVIHKEYEGPMIRVAMTQLDLLVTPDHQMLAKRRRQPHREEYTHVPASSLLEASHRIPLTGGEWRFDVQPPRPPGFMALLGFFIGDGHSSGGTPAFRLRKQRERLYLMEKAAQAGFEVTFDGRDRYHLRADEDFRLLAKKCYNEAREKIIPVEALCRSVAELEELLDGLMHSDGSVSPTGKMTYSTTSVQLAGQLQELALKTGRAALVYDHPFDRDDRHFGSKPRMRVTIYRPRNSSPRVGWTRAARERQATVEEYRGKVHCVTVPNGTLYVRRNGKPAWCGNSPFEHNSMTFYVQAPIFVFREFMRHRIASYNEESGRYRELRPVFYVPDTDRNLVQEGKPGAYVFVPGTEEQYETVDGATREACTQAYTAYQKMLAAGVAREVARGVLPVATYSSMYVTMNARSMMNFLSLRTKREDSAFPSYPQREIEMVAEKMEAFWSELMPLTYAAFNANGRVSP